jgi:hypothetical protein
MGWILRYWTSFTANRPAFVLVAHNYEEALTRLQWREADGPMVQRLYLAQNYFKTRLLERRLVRASDLVTAITAADAAQIQALSPGTPVLTLTPGYDGRKLCSRESSTRGASSILLFGSYRWSAKQVSLKRFLDCADCALGNLGINIRVVGDMTEDFRTHLEARYRSTTIIGYAEDPSPHLAEARLAIVAEPVGGGFKLKLLE